MVEALFVDVQYQGIELGRRLRMEEFAATQAYLHHPTPMPVGSTLLVDAGGGLEIHVQVTRVNEQVAGSEKPAGMFVTPLVLAQVAQRWWDARVSETTLPVTIVEVVAPERVGIESSSAEPEVAAGEDSAQSTSAVDSAGDAGDTQMMDTVTPCEVQAEQDAAGTEESAAKGKKKRRRKKRPTKG